MLLAALAATRRATAQVNWDVGAELGVMERVATGRDPGAPGPSPGPTGELHAHVALVPMVRIGAYVAHDISPVSGLPAREITEAGLRARLSPPILSGPWRAWLFLGAGYASAYEPSHDAAVPGATAARATQVAGASGGMLDVPFGLGAGCKLRRPWQIFAELGGRVGLAFSGALYGRVAGEPYEGRDSLAVSLSVGVSWGD